MIADPSIVHGTPTGHDAGCRGANCTNHRTDLLTCTQAWTRYRGDYRYMKRVDAGLTPEGIVAAELADIAAVKMAHLAEKARERRAAKSRPVHVLFALPKGKRGPRAITHGTPYGYKRGCHDRALCPQPDGVKCADAMNAHKLGIERAKGVIPRKSAEHGTASAYQSYLCHDKAKCPSAMAGGISCSEAQSDYRAARKLLTKSTMEKAA